jgi:hypothetical protein
MTGFDAVRLCIHCRHHTNPLHFENDAYPGPCAKYPGLTAMQARRECRGLEHEPIPAEEPERAPASAERPITATFSRAEFHAMMGALWEARQMDGRFRTQLSADVASNDGNLPAPTADTYEALFDRLADEGEPQ